ncbi:hypothetical protein PUN28_000910 [Cardiocondyla obscurior]|uniref:Uncharacterized protein n=1 Tax=Cardiocondyla obscurior TaxID=286306 RepID=A0AAW2H1S8_9HYME
MAKTLCLVVAFLLIFAITEASREQTNQTDGQRPHGRGATRYNSRSTTESSDLPTLETRQPRIKNSRSEVSTLEKHEAHPAGEDSIRTRSKPKQTADSFVTTSRTVSRNSNSNNGNGENSRRRQKSFSTQPPKEERARDAHEIKERKFEPPKRPTASRRSSSDASPVWVDNAKLNHDTATRPPEFLRSRTGRKIYATNGRESKSDASPSEGPPENRSAEKAESLSNEPAKEEIQSGHAKIETATEKELKKVDVKSANNSSSVGDEAKDILLSGSESVRVDVPLTVGNSEDVNFLSAVPSRQASRSAKEKPESNDISRSSAKKGRNSDRSKSRNRSKTRDPNSETSITSRRGTSKASRTEETGRSSGSRHRSNAKSATSRGRTAQKSKDAVPAEARSGRQKNADADFETSANRRTEARRDDRRTSEGKRKSKESRSKTTEAKVDGQQDARAQSRSRSRTPTSNLEITTAYIPKATVTEATTVPFANVETTTFNPTTIRPSTTPRTSSSTERVSRNKGRDRGESSRGKKPPKEDFFNHGLGFRGRKTSTEASASLVADSRTTTARSETQLRGNPGWTLKRRPGHINDATSATTASVPVDRDQTNEIVQTNDARSTEAPLNNTKSGRRGTKRPKAKDESNTISSAKGTTRGSKSFNKSEGFGLPKGTDVESDNYPPAFRARLSQLKNSNLKPTGGKSTTRTSVQERPEEHTFKRHTRSSTKTMHASEYTVENESTTDVILHVSPLTNPLTTSTPDPDTRQATKPSLASLFSERSKMKLELARRLIKPELNVDENDFDVTTDGYSESKSRAKEVSTVSESRNVEKTTKATSKLIGARTTHRNSTTVSLTKEKPTVKGRWKLLETRKLPKDRNAEAPLRPFIATTKKSRVTSERAIEETSARSVTEFAVPRLITVSHRDGILGEKATDATRVRFPTTAASREETSTLPNTVKPLEENSIPTTIEPQKLDKYIETITVASIADAAAEPKVRPTEFFQEVTLPPTVTTPGSTFQLSTLSPTRADKVYPVYVPDGKEFNSLDDGERTTIPSEGRSSVRPRYTKPQQPPEVAVSMVTSVTVGPTSRYIRKKTGVFTPYDAVPKASSTEATPAQTKRRDFRPRTSTYRRHSEVSTAGVTITPKPVKYSAQVTPGVPSPSEPFVNVQVANDTTSPTSGVVESSNGSSGNTNVFNPTRSTYFKANTTNLLEQLRSTVAPLLNNLGEKTPIFSGAYSNVNTANSPARITPNGSPPRFSARYKGAELLVRKPSVGQSVVPSITTSSTTASTPIENSGSAPPVAVSSPGEPRFVTYYQALESASIRNENLGVEDASQRQRLTGAVTKVDSNATVPNGADNDTSNNNDTVASIITTTSSPDIITTDTTTAVSPADGLPTSRLGAESNTQEAVTQTPANPDANGGETTSVPTSESPGTTFINVITNTPPTDTSTAAIASSLITTEISATVTSTSQFSTVPDFDDARFAGSTDASTETTEVPLLSSGLQTASDTPDTIAPITESVTVTRVLETTTVPINDTENFEANGVQELEETTLRATEAAYINEDIETNTVQQFDATTPYSTTESTTTIESTTTEEISNDIIEARATAAPAFSSTYRTRLIDYAQDILSRLSQKDFSTFRTPIQRPTVTTTIFPDFANAIPDSSSTNTEDFAPEEASTARGPESGTDGTTESLDFDVELVSTNGLKAATQNSISLETSSQIQFNDQETTQNVEAATVTSIPRVTDFVTQNDAQSSNDTLLTELMTIAKTLFTEAMNDTRQSIDGTDTTSTTTAQGTAGTRLFRPEQTTQTITTTAPNVMSSTTLSVTNFTTLPASSTSATSTPSAPSSSIESTTIPSLRTTPTETSSRPQFTTSVGSTSETTTVTADINENLVSTETTTDASTARVTTTTATETDDLNTISRMNDGETTTTTTTTTSAAPSTNTTTTARTTVLNRVPPSPSSMPSGSPNTPPYLNRFGGGQVTPRPGSSKAPVRDYLIYGIYPNKTIVRKRPEDNLIDGRNVDSPYVIFGIFPDGRLVRKFPNGTIIPDSPRNPVEVVFTLRTTTTTNRPAPWPYYNQANQAGSYNNQYQAPVFNYGRPVDELAGGAKSPGPLDFGVIGNAIGVTPGGPNFAGPLGPPASVPNANKMSDILLNSQMGAIPNAAFGNQQTSSTGQAQGPAGSSIFQDRERNEASRTRVTSDQRNSVYIGQDKFINYQIDGAPNVNPKVVDVRINSVASSVNEGPASSPAVPSFEGLLNNQSGGGVITAPPGFPWRDPLDQIFGITTNSPIQTASVASNQLDEPTESNASVTSRPLSPLVELFTPAVSSTTAASTTAGVTSTTTASTTTPTSTTTVSTTPTTTTTLAPTTSATTTTTSASTTTTITTTATPRTSTTTLTPSTTASATFTTGTLITIPQLAQAASFINTYAVPYTTTGVGTVPPSSTASTISANNILNRLQTNAAENPFGTTYGDLAFLNSLLQNDVKSTTPKTLSEVEQMLANRILSLALANPGPTRSPKAIQAVSLNTNAIQNRPSGSAPGPIIIDLLPVSSPPSVTSSSTSKRYTEAIPTTRPNSASTITTRAPVVITAKPKTTARPKATSQEPIGFGMGLWRALFSGNLFQTTTAASTVKKPKPSVKATTSKPVTIAQAPAQIQPTLNHVMSAIKSPTTTRSVDISDIHVASSTSLADSIISASTPSTVSTTLLNNPNPRLTDISSSTFSPDEDAKFLAALLRAIQTESATSTSTTARGLSDDDEAFLRAILSNQASIFTTATPSTEANPAALLAMLLKQQGIEPTTPATSLREQLQLSSSTPNAIPTQSTTQPITTIPINTARQVVTPKPSARPRPRPAPQTTTWAPSSTYPPPLFGGDGSSGSGLATATRAIGRFLGAAISGAAQQLQSLLRNSTRSAAG